MCIVAKSQSVLSSESVHETVVEEKPVSGSFSGLSIEQVDPPKIDQLSLPKVDELSDVPPLKDQQIVKANPPLALYSQARHEALPDRERMIEKCGRPKDDILFGAIKMSTAYKAVLSHLDKVQNALSQPDKSQNVVQQIDHALEELDSLDQVTDQYIGDKGNHRFKTEMGVLKNQILADINSLQELRIQLATSEDSLPEGFSLKEAMTYAREGIKLQDMKFFKDHGVTPQEARLLIENNPAESSIKDQIKFKHYPEKVCEDAQKLRDDIRKTGHLSFDKIPTLVNQAEYAVKLYVDVFVRSGKIPDELLKDSKSNIRSHAQLENMIEQFPMANLSDSDRELATKLMNLIHENTSLVNLQYKDFDPRFSVPQYATKEFGYAEGRTTSMDPTSRQLLPNQNYAIKMLGKELTSLVPAEKLKMPENIDDHRNISMVNSHFKGLLQDRPDICIAFGLLEGPQIENVLKEWVDHLPSLTESQKDDLKNDVLPKLISENLPKQGQNLTVGKKLGEGSFGTVHEGTFKDQPVVIKFIKKDKIKDYAGLVVESLRQAELRDNPYAPKFVGIQPGKGTFLVVMDKVDGGDYKDLLKNKLPIAPPIQVANYNKSLSDRAMVSIHCISGMAKGLEPLHQRGLVHCDLKSANVMFDSKTLEPRLIDFGLCAKKGENFRGGTPITMSPEVALNSEPQPASDIYALGCIMYEQITGGYISVRGQKQADNFNDPLWNSSPMKECKPFIQACLKTDPNERPTTEQILQAVRGETVTPSPKGAPGIKDVSILDVLKPDTGYTIQAQNILASKFKN